MFLIIPGGILYSERKYKSAHFIVLGVPLGIQNEGKIPSHPSPTPALWSLGQPWAATTTRLGYIGTIWEQFRLVWILFWSYFAKAL